MSSPTQAADLGQVLVDFSANGAFPEEEEVSAAYVNSPMVSAALVVLQDAKVALENEVREISRETAPDVDLWIKHAKSIQHDINQSRQLASSIVRQAEADEERKEVLVEKETYANFLEKEVSFDNQLISVLQSLQGVNEKLTAVEGCAHEARLVERLHMLEAAFNALNGVKLEKTSRAMRLLDTRCFAIRASLQEELFTIWKALIIVDQEVSTITIRRELPGSTTSIVDAMIALQSFHQLDVAAKKLWDDLDDVIFRPRTNLRAGDIPSNSLSLGAGLADNTIKSLFVDLQTTIKFLHQNIPAELTQPLAKHIMPIISARVIETWLDAAVPASLEDMVDYQKALALVGDFAAWLDTVNWPGAEGFHDWVSNASRIWLAKRRETALDWTRNQLSLGTGSPQISERIETRMVAKEEADNTAATGTAATHDWDDAWSDGGEETTDDSVAELQVESRHRASLEEERRASEVFSPIPTPDEDQTDDAADAWGWGDDYVPDADASAGASPTQPKPGSRRPSVQQNIAPTCEVTLSEKYWTSSFPRTVYGMIERVYADGATLTRPENEHVPVTPAAPSLFGLPTLILALYRAISPSYYSLEPGGNMYLYNDAMWLSERLEQFTREWQNGEVIPERAYNLVRLDPEIKVLVSFGKRAYTSELNAQRTVINDLLGGAQNFFQPEYSMSNELLSTIRIVIKHIRTTATLWYKILPYSAWASATGSLVNAVATKLISDVFDLTDISVDEAERTATVLSHVETLDDLFLPKHNPANAKSHNGTLRSRSYSTIELDLSDRGGGGEDGEVPLTSQFADKWMKMKFLSEVLQSNLKDVRFLWFESDLSLYFTVDEVVELVGLSFERNLAVRGLLKDIRENPYPRG
ncbi:uncharacterized protein RAG0_04056 [Rhynchosporium agropyri]|uniref:ZW10 C-terminal helical domain-containing protein n=1 Tax=Rhynchosporium agropyri TaxID=914238 RepID=A0A1E1KBF9_9HELO|nr:uncharacterized protein RAG0_04056 [Rhynchosporium agropyri]